MALSKDINDVLQVFVYSNLAAIAANQPIAVSPAVEQILQVPVLNNLGNIGLPPDIRQIAEDFFVNTTTAASTISTTSTVIITTESTT
ncbi:hypothetical protein P22_2018 [Propionispora sp. 2/2-37]|uniref:hypothetical protein n=1 Tax=Propionispora sp. 2/2-37 TaxID=1677858 RepID=UPI0006C198B1|nr:hypothetical protein [Propionispora sp. 2/2-37]CUH95930.1 hypothetical protein P22_2018 [Propionispora sp. 2/2-37]